VFVALVKALDKTAKLAETGKLVLLFWP